MVERRIYPVVRKRGQFGKKGAEPTAGGWLSASKSRGGMALLDRMGQHAQSVFGSGSVSTQGPMRVSNPYRVLTFDQLRLVYQRTPDVRSSVDQITRRVATWDWMIEPQVNPRDERFEGLLEICANLTRFLQAPNTDGETWQEWATKTITDLLVYDAGASELVLGRVNRRDTLEEMVSLRGAEIIPETDDYGRLVSYQQSPFRNEIGQPGGTRGISPIRFDPAELLYLRLFPNNEGPEGFPLIESIVNEIIAILRASEHAMFALDADEIPPGILVLSGIAKAAAKEAKADLQTLRGQDHKIRVMTTATPNVGASWVELRHTPKELTMAEVVDAIRRTIWRVFGVLPVEMGNTDGMPRATAQVQLDVSSSHLLTPILDLLEAKINARILPLLIRDENLVPLVRFRFDRERDLTPQEYKAKVDALLSMVSEGVITRNEMREELGYHPQMEEEDADPGDAFTYSGTGSVTRLSEALEEKEEPPPMLPGMMPEGEEEEEEEEGETEPQDAPEDETETAPGENEESVEESAGGRLETRSPACRMDGETIDDCADRKIPELIDEGYSRDQAVAIAYDLCEKRCSDQSKPCNRSVGELRGDLPSEWQSPGKFSGYRTVSLRPLWEEVAGFARDVDPIYDATASRVVSIIQSEYQAEGFGEAESQRALARVFRELDRLADEWYLVTRGRYVRAAEIGKTTAERFTGQLVVEDFEARAETFQNGSLSHLVSRDGLLGTIRNRLSLLLAKTVDVRGAQRVEDLGVDAAEEDVLRAAEAVFVSQKHRIAHYQGKLIELTYAVTGVGLNEVQTREDVAASFFGDEEAAQRTGIVEWYVQWSAVGTGSCPTCSRLGGEGYIPLRNLPTVPGGATECGGNCRCILVYWTKDEIDNGKAVRI